MKPRLNPPLHDCRQIGSVLDSLIVPEMDEEKPHYWGFSFALPLIRLSVEGFLDEVEDLSRLHRRPFEEHR